MLTKIDIRMMDLNLLPKFRALYHRRSVSAAARDLFVTQPAVSNALAKMRDLFQDELFVRTPEGMVPTPLAHSIREAIEPALGLIEGGLEKAGLFDPGSSARHFRLAMSEVAEFALLPHVIKATLAVAPGIGIESVPAHRVFSAEDLRSGVIDAAVGIDVAGPRVAVRTEILGRFKRVAIMRAGHPMTDADSETIAHACEFVEAREQDGGRRRPESVSDANRFRTANLFSLPSLVAATDLVAIVPEWLAAHYASKMHFVVLADPIGAEPDTLSLTWHAASEEDRGLRWLRSVLTEAASTADFMAEPSSEAAARSAA